ncbi:hypothetical protein NGB36_23345 [Streptomyces sp. RB6PN25]|uniref:Ig-like domain-containing protein n=1 Tax=Streptomyces humicola TaxID=2953240 RepID=A0ABT1Q0K6_9ACTN|nr:hypothetical protein [Streptomyces humicola]MCQ4083461.1 hypothetical protein [Streptomyces humicola]
MIRTHRVAAFTFLVAPALVVGPAVAAQASNTIAPGAPSRATCNVERDSLGKYHLWGLGFPPNTKLTYSGSSSGTVPTDRSGRFDIGGLNGSKFVIKSNGGKSTTTCTMVSR